MTESQLTRVLLTQLRMAMSRAVIFKHNDRSTAGIPDFSVTHNGYTAWFEVKVCSTACRIKGRGLQHVTARRLSLHGICWYIVFTPSEVHLVRPKNITGNGFFTTEPQCTAPRSDLVFVVEFIRAILRGATE